MINVINDLNEVLGNLELLLAELVIEDKTALTPMVNIALASVVKIKKEIENSGLEVDNDLSTAETILGVNLNDGSTEEYMLSSHVLESVIEACKSADKGKLEDHMIDNIMVNIVKHHGARKCEKSKEKN